MNSGGLVNHLLSGMPSDQSCQRHICPRRNRDRHIAICLISVAFVMSKWRLIRVRAVKCVVAKDRFDRDQRDFQLGREEGGSPNNLRGLPGVLTKDHAIKDQ